MEHPSQGNGRATAIAYLQVLLAGILWATSGPFSIALHRLGLPPTSVALLRPATGGLLLGLILLFWHGRRIRPTPGALLWMLLGGGVIVGVFQLAYQMSTAAVGVPATVALLYLAPALVILGSRVIFGEPITPVKGTLAIVSVVGVWLTVMGAEGLDVELTPAGILWGCLCGISYASYTIFGKGFGARHGALAPLFWSTLGGSVLLGAVWLLSGEPVILPDDALTWATLLLFGFLTIGGAPLLLFHAMRTIQAGRAAIGTTIEPLVATLLAVALLDQVLTPGGWLGMGLLLVGVTGAYATRTRRPEDDRSRP